MSEPGPDDLAHFEHDVARYLRRRAKGRELIGIYQQMVAPDSIETIDTLVADHIADLLHGAMEMTSDTADIDDIIQRALSYFRKENGTQEEGAT